MSTSIKGNLVSDPLLLCPFNEDLVACNGVQPQIAGMAHVGAGGQTNGGAHLYQSSINRFPNPRIASLSWVSHAVGTSIALVSKPYVGSTCVSASRTDPVTDNAQIQFASSATLVAPVTDVTFSGYVNFDNASRPKGSYVQARATWSGGAHAGTTSAWVTIMDSSAVNAADEWEFIAHSVVADYTDRTQVSFQIRVYYAAYTPTFALFDAVQIEQFAWATPFFHGDMGDGYAWTGAADDSASTRTNGQVQYPVANTSDFTVAAWINPLNVSERGGAETWLTWKPNSGNETGWLLRAVYSSGQLLLQYNLGSGNLVWFTPIYDNAWVHVAWVKLAGTAYLYVNGALANSSSITSLTAVSYLSIGTQTSSEEGCVIADGLFAGNRALSAGEINDIYSLSEQFQELQCAPPVTTSIPFLPLRTLLVGDKFGGILAELEATMEEVTWLRNDVGRARLRFALGDSKINETNLRYGNRVLIQFGNGLPDWGGVIDTPRAWGRGAVTVTAYSGEHILGQRRTDKGMYFSGASVGAMLIRIIQEANAVADTGIDVGGVWLGGALHSPEYHLDDLLEILQASIAGRLSTADFAVQPVLVDGKIRFRAFLWERRGHVKRDVWLVEGHNTTEAELVEQGPIINSVTIAGADLSAEGASGWGNGRLIAMYDNAASIARYGLRQWSSVYQDVVIQSSLDEIARARVGKSAQPQNIVDVTVVDRSPANYRDYDIGDTIRGVFPGLGFAGYDKLLRLDGREYRQATGTCRLIVSEEGDPYEPA